MNTKRVNTQLISAQGFNFNDITFGEPKRDSGETNNRRVPILTKYRNERGDVIGEGDLFIPTTELFSYGPKVNLNKPSSR